MAFLEFERVVIPPAVYEEAVVRGRALGEPDAAIIDDAAESGWIDVVEPDVETTVDRYDLEAGERGVLALAFERDHGTVLIIEESVREIARLLGRPPRGTLSILFEALARSELDFDDLLDHLERLIAYGSYLEEAVYLEAVRRARALDEE